MAFSISLWISVAIFIDIIIMEKKLCYKTQSVFSALLNEMLEVDQL